MSLKRKDVEKIHADGLINEELRDKIIGHYHLEESSSGRWLFICLSLLAALLLTGGAAMLVASRWEELTLLGKIASGAILLGGVWTACLLTQKRIPLLSEGLAIIGAALWGGNIALHADVFGMHRPFVEGCFLFFIGLAFIPFLLRQRALMGVVAVTSFILLFSMVEENSDSWLSFSWSRPPYVYGNNFAAFVLLSIFWWLLGEKSSKRSGDTGRALVPAWLSIPAFITTLALLEAALLYPNTYTGLMLDTTGYVMLAAAPALCLLLKPRGVSWLSWLLLVASTCLLLPLAIHLSWLPALQGTPDTPWYAQHTAIFAVLACALYAIILMSIGARSGRVAWVNYGALMAIFAIIGMLTNIFKSLDNSGLALLISGSVVLICALLLESQRRRFVKKAKQQNSTPSVA